MTEGVRLEWVHENPIRLDQIRALFVDYQAELGVDLCFQRFDEEIRDLPGKYAAPAGGLILALAGKTPVGCGAFRPLREGVAELKRIYAVPAARGKGLGRTITEALIEAVRAAGYPTVYLDTLARLTAANALYARLGFTETTPYNDNPEPDVRYYSRSLSENRPEPNN